jgi:hypothetical protein
MQRAVEVGYLTQFLNKDGGRERISLLQISIRTPFLAPRVRDRTFALPRDAPVAALRTPPCPYPQTRFAETPSGSPYNPHVRLLSPGPLLVGTTKVYSGIGVDIVMESISPTIGKYFVVSYGDLRSPI